jgi:hypothetical protein
MVKTYHNQEIATIDSKLQIELKQGQIIIEQMIESNSFDDDHSIFLSFNKQESKNLFKYYKTENDENLIDHIHQNYRTYNSLKHFQEFFTKKEIKSILSSGCALTD